MDSSLWYRTFTRGAKPGPPDQYPDDIDRVANNDFIQSHFTDTFGLWLTQGNNKFEGTLDGLLSIFFRMPPQANFSTVNLTKRRGQCKFQIANLPCWRWHFHSNGKSDSVVQPSCAIGMRNYSAITWCHTKLCALAVAFLYCGIASLKR